MPFVLWRLWRRGRTEPGYRLHVGERLSLGSGVQAEAGCIWVHAVSVGETRAAQPLIDALLASSGSIQILLTHMTPTGRETGRSLFSAHGSRVVQAYLPYDTGLLMRRFLRRHRPVLCVLMETEVWPNLVAACRQSDIPVALVNARLSERSLRKGQRYAALLRPATEALSVVAAQSEADAQRIRQMGANAVTVTGSMKFDIAPPAASIETGRQLRAMFGARPVLVCGCTRDGEETLILDAFLATSKPRPLLVMVPRHPQRFDEVQRLIEARGLRLERRSMLTGAPGALATDTEIVLGDTMGEMFAYYACADVAFVGGSLAELGGHNIIEPCAVGCPTLVGPHTFNFLDITDDAIAAGAVIRVPDASALLKEASRLLSDQETRDRVAASASQFAALHRGATAKTLACLQSLQEKRAA